MPATEVVLFAEEDGVCPLLEWMDTLPPKAQDKCIVKIERLARRGMNCVGQRLIFFGIRSMSFGRLYEGSNIECSTSFTLVERLYRMD